MSWYNTVVDRLAESRLDSDDEMEDSEVQCLDTWSAKGPGGTVQFGDHRDAPTPENQMIDICQYIVWNITYFLETMERK